MKKDGIWLSKRFRESWQYKKMYGEGVAMDDERLMEMVQSVTSKSSKEMSDDAYLAMYKRAQEVYDKTGRLSLLEKIEIYTRSKKNHTFGDTVDYLRMEKVFWLNAVLMDGFTLGCHRAVHVEKRLMEQYRREVSDADGRLFIPENMLHEYAYFRRFFNCVAGRYSLKDKRLLARHFFMNSEKSRDVLFNFFTDISMLRIVQFDMDAALNGDEAKLKEIRIFKPEEVLDYVDRLAEFMKLDPVLVRGIWVRIMSRYEEIMRDANGKMVYAFKPTKGSEEFNKRFVAGVIGLLADMGVYRIEWKRMSEALEEDEVVQERIASYMEKRCKGVNVTKEGMEVIREVAVKRI